MFDRFLNGDPVQLIDAIKLSGRTRLALVGAGGKTTVMFRLAGEWVNEKNSSIFLTTSTHLAKAEAAAADHHFIIRDLADFEPVDANLQQGIILVTGPEVENSRLAGLTDQQLMKLHELAQKGQMPMLIEADGSSRKPLKAPAAFEPVIPDFVDTVVVIVGMEAFGKPLIVDWVHRPEIYSQISGLSENSTITAGSICQMLLSVDGGLKEIPLEARKVVLFNNCTSTQAASAANSIIRPLLQAYHQVIIADLKLESDQEVISNNFQVAGIILAAGGGQRLGQPKQLLDWQGQPFVRAVANNAIIAGLFPVVVVVGAFAAEVTTALEGLEVVIVKNLNWKAGQSSSLKTGIDSLPPDVQAVVVSLVDQPQVPPPLIEALVAEYAAQPHTIVAPMIDHRRGNPVLFDRATFQDLVSISGDAGGRMIFSRHLVHMLTWLDPRMGLDVDSMEDYQRLLDAWETS